MSTTAEAPASSEPARYTQIFIRVIPADAQDDPLQTVHAGADAVADKIRSYCQTAAGATPEGVGIDVQGTPDGGYSPEKPGYKELFVNITLPAGTDPFQEHPGADAVTNDILAYCHGLAMPAGVWLEVTE